VTMRMSTLLAGGLCLVAAAALPVAGHWIRGRSDDGCALDGAAIGPAFRVRVVDAAGHSRCFCCIRCAELWLTRQPSRPGAIYVTDETTGHEMEAAAAYFVRSRVVTNPGTGNRIHAFARRADAAKHAAVGGTLLEGTDRPFHGAELGVAKSH
jgi:hypothetical protein